MRAASVRIEHVSHRYPGARRLALDDVGFDVEPGQRVGLLGPNGAGKSTLMRLLCGFLPMGETGKLTVAGLDVRADSRRVRAGVGYLPEHVPLYHELRAIEHLTFRARIKGVAWRRRKAEIERVAGLTGIADVLHTPVGQLSRGYRQRVGLADALLGEPPLVILDEPTVGLDPNQVREVRAMLRDLGGAQTLLFSSHILAEVEMLCDHVIILSQGRVVANESLAEATRATHVEVGLSAERAAAEAVLEAAVGGPVSGARWSGQDGAWSIVVELGGGTEADALLAAVGEACVAQRVVATRLARGTTRLEERFAEVTGGRGLGPADPVEVADGP
jgi:ABC-2 type transport system ATP-binding protein